MLCKNMRATSLLTLSALAIALGLAGCSTAPENAKSGSSPSPEPAAKSTRTPAPLEVPEELQNDAYAYSGLGHGAPLTFAMTGGAGDDDEVVQEIALTEVKDGAAIFTVRRTGILGQFGAETLKLDANGLSLVGYERAQLSAPALNVPATLEIGRKWESTVDLKADSGQAAKVTMTMRSVRLEKVKTKGGEFDTLLVAGEGVVTSGDVTSKVEVKQWMAKGLGIVKQEYVQTSADGSPTKMSLELVKRT